MAGLFDMITGAAPMASPTYDPATMQQMNDSLSQQMVPPSQGQTQQPQPLGVPNHSLTGILGIHGVPGQLLNWLGDSIATAAGMQLPFKDDPAKRAQAAAMQGFTDNPMAAVQKLAATGDTTGATSLYENLVRQQQAQAQLGLERQRVGSEVQATQQKIDDTVRSQAGKLISSATPDTYATLYGHASDVFGKKADLSPLNLFDPKDLDKYTTVDPKTGKKSWTPEAQTILDQANTFNVPEYRYLGSQAAQDAAAARAVQAGAFAAQTPSRIAANNAAANAAGANAGAHAQQVNTYTAINTDPVTGQVIPVIDPRRHPPTGSNHRPAPGVQPQGQGQGQGPASQDVMPANAPTISVSKLPQGSRTGMIGNRKVALLPTGQKVFIGP